MSLDIDARTVTTGATDFEPGERIEYEMLWVENVVTVVGTVIAVVVVSSVAVLMYLA